MPDESPDTVDWAAAKNLVRRGYDALSVRYEQAYDTSTKYRDWIEELRARVPPGGSVLDLGCGCGLPVARDLVSAGYQVTGVDISGVQLRRARELVPAAEFIEGDAAVVDLPAAGFDAVVCLYMLIHVPLPEQPGLLARITQWLRPGGWFLATMGHTAWTGTEDDWLGGGATMFWSHADAATNRGWLGQAGLTVRQQEFVPEGDSGHALFWARRP